MADTTKSTNTTILNGVPFEYEYKVWNDGGEISFNDSSVIALELEDNLFTPFMGGTITFANNYNYIESKYVYRGDSSDKLHLYIKHKGSGIVKGKVEQVDKVIDQVFTIVEEYNYIDDGTQAKNRKTYKFIHEHESKLRELFPYEKRYFGRAGSIICEILKYDLGFEVSDGETFEPGNLEIDSFPEMIIPTMPFRYLDIIYYMLKYYYYKGFINEPPVKGILRLNKKTMKYELHPLINFFKKHNQLVYETLMSGDLVSLEEKPSVNINNPPGAGLFYQFINNTTSINMSVPGTSTSNSHYMNAMVVSYDHIYGSSRMSRILVSTIRRLWESYFVDVFKAVGGKVKRHLNLTDYKKSKEFKIVRLPFTHEDNVNITIADMISNFVFYNQQLNLNVVGEAGREPGTFIDIVKGKDDKDHKGDEVLLGRWFVTGVRHLKLQNTFRSEIFCVKTYAGPRFKSGDATRK